MDGKIKRKLKKLGTVQRTAISDQRVECIEFIYFNAAR